MRRRPGLAPRLFVAQLLVLVVAVTAAVAVAAVVGPSIFRDHLGEGAHDGPDGARLHAEEAFQDAGVISVLAAALTALVVAVAVSAFATRRITGPVRAFADAAADVAAGRYAVTVPTPALGAEFETLHDSFTAMAARLQSVETTRRRLLGDLAHEMRTPVATIDAYLEGFEDGVATLDVETAAMLRSQIRRLGRLAEDVSAVSRAEEHQLDVHPVPAAPGELVTAAVTAAADRFTAKGVQLLGQVPASLPAICVDVDRFAQVLGNLLDNALRHTPKGGRVEVAAEAHGRDVLVSVRDTGSGIPAEHLPHVFERFYRADSARDRQHGGSGIGLAIARALVEAQGGRIDADSPGLGQGSTFTIALPAVR